MKHPRYPEYRASGVDWLGEVPAHWEVRRLKTVALVRMSNVDKKSVEDQQSVRLCNYVDVYYNQRITTDIEFMEATATTDQIAAFELRCGDVLITKDSETPDDIAVPALVVEDLEGVLCGYHLAHIRPDQQRLDGVFLAWAIRATCISAQFHSTATGVTRFGLCRSDITGATIMMPPLDEQRAIAAFLDRETARIDALIATKRRFIALLQEKRAALISHAVTRGVDPDAPLKDSGIEWIGEIPAHWASIPFKYVCHISEGQVDPEEDEYLDWLLVAPNHIESGTARLLARETAREQGAISGKYQVREGDVVYSKIRPALNKLWIADTDALCSADMYPVTCDSRLAPEFLVAFMLSGRFVQRVVDESMRVAMPKINRESLGQLHVVLPPIGEQRAITDYLRSETRRIDQLQAHTELVIERLAEIRSSLIASGVIGRIDLRTAA